MQRIFIWIQNKQSLLYTFHNSFASVSGTVLVCLFYEVIKRKKKTFKSERNFILEIIKIEDDYNCCAVLAGFKQSLLCKNSLK